MEEETLYDRRNKYIHLDSVSSTLIRGDTIFLVKVIVSTEGDDSIVTLTESGNTITLIKPDHVNTQGNYTYYIPLDNLTVDIITTNLVPDITVIYR